MTDNNLFITWERQLMDLSMSNPLVNTHFGEQCILFRDSCDDDFLDELLHIHRVFRLLGANRRAYGLYVDMKQDVLNQIAKNIRRISDDNDIETRGYQLYLGIGMLHYTDKPNMASESHCAPVMLTPVTLIPPERGEREYCICSSDHLLHINSTLVELLYQKYNRDLRELVPAVNESADYKRVCEAFRNLADDKKGWQFTAELCVGIFAFPRFSQWYNIHWGSNAINKSELVHRLAEQQPFTNEEQPANAILLSGDQGSDHSETIATIITNMLSHDKRVLYVAQNHATVRKVQKHLQEFGLGLFCPDMYTCDDAVRLRVQEQLHAIFELMIDRPSDKPGKIEGYEHIRQKLIKNARIADRNWDPKTNELFSHTMVYQWARYKEAVPLTWMMKEYGKTIHKIIPCMLMSPISVAQCLNLKLELFDTVILDDAGQIPTAEAVGVIARGRTTVVIANNEKKSQSKNTASIWQDLLKLGMKEHHLIKE